MYEAGSALLSDNTNVDRITPCDLLLSAHMQPLLI
jgi:hypothetical protein